MKHNIGWVIYALYGNGEWNFQRLTLDSSSQICDDIFCDKK